MKKNRRSNRGSLFVGAVLLLAPFLWMILSASSFREDNSHINPEIYDRFRQIESDCLGEDIELDERCRELLVYMFDTIECRDAEMSSKRKCRSSTFYLKLQELGFTLPPYFEDGYSPNHSLEEHSRQ